MPSLLIVDDDERQRTSIESAARLASFSPHEIIMAEGEDDAYLLVEGDRTFDLAVIDIMLTEKEQAEGLRLISVLHKKQPACCVIALSTKVGNEFGIPAINNGARDFISSKWEVNWFELLVARLNFWKDVIDSKAKSLSS